MDKVRLGRALGYGARHLGKTIAAVAEASTAPGTPNRSSAESGTPVRNSHRPASEPVLLLPTPSPVFSPASGSQGGPKQTGRTRAQLKRSFWQPLAVFSGALWLRVTGTFFALLASTMFTGAWRLRGNPHYPAATSAAHHLWLFLSFGVLFGYFAVSSFVRAIRKERHAGS